MTIKNLNRKLKFIETKDSPIKKERVVWNKQQESGNMKASLMKPPLNNSATPMHQKNKPSQETYYNGTTFYRDVIKEYSTQSYFNPRAS